MKVLYSKENDSVALSAIFVFDQIVGTTCGFSKDLSDEYIFILTEKFLESIDCLAEAEELRKECNSNDKNIHVIADCTIKSIPKRFKWIEKYPITWISDVGEIEDACLKIAKDIVFEGDYITYKNMHFSNLVDREEDVFMGKMLEMIEKYGSDVKIAMLLVKIIYLYILQYGVNNHGVHPGELLARSIEFVLADRVGTGDYTYIEYEFLLTCLKKLIR